MRVTSRINHREFDATMRVYRQYSKRDPATICNTKGFYIARRATVETVKTPASKIREFIGEAGGRIIGMIINKGRAKRGEKGLYGRAMAKMVAMVKAARLRSRAFLASGWIFAIKALEPFAEKRGAPRQDRTSKQYGQAKGYGLPATDGWKAKAILANLASARWDRGGAEKNAVNGLQKAFDFERASMLGYVERKMRETAKRAGVKVKG